MAGQGIGIALALGLDVDERDASVLRRPQVVGFTADANLSHRMRGQRFEIQASATPRTAPPLPILRTAVAQRRGIAQTAETGQRVQGRVETLRPQLVQRIAHATLTFPCATRERA